ncbi:MAG: sulfatase [Planctomycetota bacterium]
MADSNDRPNILFVLSDDHAAHAISAYTDAGLGPELLRTPHLDRLADEGVRAQNCFCTNAICTPSRASILTGQHTHTCGVRTLHDQLDNTHEPQLQKLLSSAGYRTAIFGKWHLGHGPASDPAGFDEWAVLPGQGLYYDPRFFIGNTAGRRGELHTKGYVTDLTTEMGLDFLRRWHEGGASEPFFCCVHHKAPHREWEPGPEEKDLLEGVTLPEPATLWDDYAGRPAAAAARMRIDQDLLPKDVKASPPAGLSAEDRKRWYYDRYIKDYLRCCAGVDKSVGQLTRWLEDHGQLDNTIVVYTSDQGFFLGDHGWYDKRFIYEHALRMPLLMRGPGIETSAPEAMLTNVDFAPTLLELAGLEVHPQMQGRSFASVLRGEGGVGGEPADWQQAVYYRYWMDSDHTHHTTAHYGLRTKTHKLSYFYADPLDATGSGHVNLGIDPYWELFDLGADPEELRNIYGEAGTEDLVVQLKTQLRALQTQFGDEPVDEVA